MHGDEQASQSIGSMPIEGFLAALSAKTPTPGGGAVAGLAGATAAALARMVNAYSLGRKSLHEHQAALQADAHALDAMRQAMLDLADADARAYARLNRAQRAAEGSAESADRVEAARAAAAVPEAVAQRAVETLELLAQIVERSNPFLLSDLAIAAVLAESAARSAGWNVRANAPELPDERERAALLERVRALISHARAVAQRVESLCERDGRGAW